MKTHLLFYCMLIIAVAGLGQTKYQGYIYDLQTDARKYFTYSASTSFYNEAFRTTYNVYGDNGKVRYIITADHYKDDKKVFVEVNDVRYLLSSMNAKEQTTYDQPSLKLFGFKGNVALFDRNAPNQLAVQFLSDRFEHVRVINFLGSYDGGNFRFFIFKSTDKISEQPGRSGKPSSVTDPEQKTKPKAIFRGANTGINDPK